MVHYSKKFLLVLLLITSIFFSRLHTYAVTNYIKLHPESSSHTVTKFQTFFKELSIYTWEIDWEYTSIQSELIDFQVESWIISNISEDWAWYVWPKTYSFLTKKFGNELTSTYNDVFEISEAEVWEDTFFVVSAYYSPLKWQKRYATWSYAWDIRLNGNGTHWASWAAVHPWFIAAPSNYDFGTKIEIEGLWIWTVEDRWGAIVNAWVRGHAYDRLDIWMWYGDDWLTRALNWWKKTVAWKIMPVDSPNTIEYSGYINSTTGSTNTTQSTSTSSTKNLAIKITPKSSHKDINTMQTLFSEAWIYSWEINWNYSSFKESIIDFQVTNWVIATRTSIWHWYIWAKTITKLKEKYPDVFIQTTKKEVEDKKVEIQETKTEIIGLKKEENEEWEEKENKKEEKIDTRFQVTVSKSVQKKYDLTDSQDDQIQKISEILNNALEEKYGWDNLKLKTQKNKLRKTVLELIEKVDSETTKEKLRYLYDLLKES